MKKPFLASLVAILAGGGAAGGVACSSSSNHGSGGQDAGMDAAVEGSNPGPSGFSPVLACSDTIASVYADPGNVGSLAKGAIIHCAHDKDYSASALYAAAQTAVDGGDPTYAGKAFTSGAHIYRVLYRTERGDTNGSPGYSSAAVLLPDTPRASTLPIVIASHGSRGQAGLCAPTMLDPSAYDVNGDFVNQVYSLVGNGYAVIAPDLAGYANFGGANNPPSAYADSADVGKSTLDAAKALRNVLPSVSLTQQIVITGHSQGGHTALSALALSSIYAPAGSIVAVAVYSPLWISQHAWGAIFLAPPTYAFTQSSAGPVSLWYHYTHAVLLDGPDSGFPIFNPSKLSTVTSFVDSDCWLPSYPVLEDAGTSANDFFTQSYVNSIDFAATPLGNGNCNGNADCKTWFDRMTADWPHLAGAAAQVPILVWYGNDDQTISTDKMQCVFDRLSTDKTPFTVCYDPNPVGHGGVVAHNADYVADWIAEKVLGAPAPSEACQSLQGADAGSPQLVDEGGTPIPCNPLLLNE
jgi:predicted esterase